MNTPTKTTRYLVAEIKHADDGTAIPARYVTEPCPLDDAKRVRNALGDKYAIFEVTTYGEVNHAH